MSSDDLLNYSVIKGLTGLETLIIKNNNFGTKKHDIDFIENLKNISVLKLKLKADDYSSIKHLDKLKELDLSFTDVNDITWVGDLSELEVLDITHTDVRDISILANLKRLTALNIADTKVNDIRPLYSLTNLSFLNVNDAQIMSDYLQELRKKFPELSISYNSSD